MVILKKIRASTLMETLIATVLVVVVFMVASLILNNLFLNINNFNSREVNARLDELHYLYDNKKFEVPHEETFNEWQITIETIKEGKKYKTVEFEAVNRTTTKTIAKQFDEIE